MTFGGSGGIRSMELMVSPMDFDETFCENYFYVISHWNDFCPIPLRKCTLYLLKESLKQMQKIQILESALYMKKFCFLKFLWGNVPRTLKESHCVKQMRQIQIWKILRGPSIWNQQDFICLSKFEFFASIIVTLRISPKELSFPCIRAIFG